jgi:CDP-glucose 4,6-dehydratase
MESVGIVNPSFWKNRKVLITGHTGFKGAWLTLWLQKLGAKVVGFSKGKVGTPNLFDIIDWDSSFVNIVGDIRDISAVDKVISDYKPEIIFHLAAQSLVRFSYEDPLETFSSNVMGTVNVLDSARRSSSVQSVINVTSDKCYENKEWAYAYRENDAFGGKDPYSASKGCAEIVASAYRSSYYNNIGLASVRAGNVIGGGDWALDRLVPDCMVAFSKKSKVIVRNPNAIRPWQHVLEALRGYIILAQELNKDHKSFSKGYNFGPSHLDTQPVSYIVSELCKHWGSSASWELENQSQQAKLHEANFLRLDSSLAYNELKWRPILNLDQALKKSANWYRAYYDGKPMTRYSLDDLEEMEQ